MKHQRDKSAQKWHERISAFFQKKQEAQGACHRPVPVKQKGKAVMPSLSKYSSSKSTKNQRQGFDPQRPISQPESWPRLGLETGERNLATWAGTPLQEMQMSCMLLGLPGGTWHTQTLLPTLLPLPQAALIWFTVMALMATGAPPLPLMVTIYVVVAVGQTVTVGVVAPVDHW